VLATMEGKFEEAIAAFAPYYAGNLDNPGVRLAYGQTLALGHRTDDALTVFAALARDFPDSPFTHLGLFYASALRGDVTAASRSISPEVEATLGGDAQYCWFLAECYALANDAAASIRWLERAVSLGFINYPLLAERDPFLASIRKEPAFTSLINDVQRRWESFTV